MEVMYTQLTDSPALATLSKPTLQKEHNITVTIMTVDGEKKQATINMKY